MSAELWALIAKIAAALGGGSTVLALGKWTYDRWTGRTDRKMVGIRSAIDAMGEAAVYADYAASLITWCRQHHGYDPGMPPWPDLD